MIARIDARPLEALFLSAITVAEMRAGVALLPAGKRRDSRGQNLEKHLLPAFAGRVLAFDLAFTPAYADLIARARAAGRAIASADGVIAAIAASHGFAVATRDADPFASAGVAVINPWQG